MRPFIPFVAVTLTACTANHAAIPAMNGSGPPDAAAYGAAVVQGYAQARVATQPFHDLDAAVAAGYAAQVAQCFTDSVHAHGAMGYHHVNRAYMDSIVDVGRPEILLYERKADSSYVLNGVEYILPYRYWPRDSVPPRLMGRELFPEDERQYWYAHMWVWTDNPRGLFADWNPAVACPG
jgi:hypothetical protein